MMRTARWTCAMPLVLAAGCALPHTMERAGPAGSHCPELAAANPGEHRPDRAGVLWYRAADDRDRELAARWCATVGETVVDSTPEPSRTAEWAEDEDLQVVTWNMWIGGGDLYRLLDEELGIDCTSEAPDAVDVAQPFVLLLQEVWRYSEALPQVEGSRIIPYTIDPDRSAGEDRDIVEAARRCGLALVYVPSARNGPDTGSRPSEDKGNAILANVALLNPIAIDLPLEGGRKVAVAATVSAPAGRRVRVVSVHLDVASTLVRTVFSGYQTRVRQAMGLVDGLAGAEADGHAVDATVVGADMNTWAANESALRRTLAAFPQSPAWDGLPTRGPFPTDHIFFRTREGSRLVGGGYERVRDTYSSDHHPRRFFVRDEVD